MKRNLITRTVGSVLVLRQNRGEPSDAEWADTLRQLRALLRVHGGNAKTFVYTEGGAPNADQRDLLQREIVKTPIRTAVVSDNTAARMTSSTVALANRNHRSFGVAEVSKANEFLGLTATEITDVQETLGAMATLLG